MIYNPSYNPSYGPKVPFSRYINLALFTSAVMGLMQRLGTGGARSFLLVLKRMMDSVIQLAWFIVILCDLMVIWWDFMGIFFVIYGDLMGFHGDLMWLIVI